MNKNKKIILGVVLTIIIVFSGIITSWLIFFRGQPPLKYPDLIISNYSLENDNLVVNITNIGDTDATAVDIIAEIGSIPLVLYNDSVDLNINEIFMFSINLSNFETYFSSGNSYTIAIRVDPNNSIQEKLENNNEINVDYYYEQEIPTPLSLFSPNTYSFNSSIDTFGYAVQFNSSQILIEDSLIITNGTINGYNVVNSTILENTTISNNLFQIYIALYENQNLTIRNVWDNRLSIALSDSSTLSLFNCSIEELAISGSNNIFLSNSSIKTLSSSQNLTKFVSLKIINHSSIDTCILSSPTFLEIEYTSIHTLYILVSGNPYSQHEDYLISGSIRNCSIYMLLAYGQTNLNIYGTDIYQISIIGKTRLNLVECIITEEYVSQNAISILNNTKILSELSYGIIVYANSVNITNGVIQGTDYINNTILINANVSSMILKTVSVNNTGQVFISNYSCTLFLYNYANAIINDSNITTPNEYGGYLEGSSKLTGINSSFGFVLSQENSSVDLSEGSVVQSLFLNNSNDISIDSCTFDKIYWYSETQGGRKAEIFNSTIENFYAPSSSKVDIINSSIDMLYEGISFQAGTNFMNSSGISGAGVVLNNLNFSDTVISNRTYKFIEIGGDAKVIINDLHNLFSIFIESGDLTVNNCTIESLQMRNNAIVYLNNCSSPDTGGFVPILLSPPAFMCSDNSHLYINNTIIFNGYMIMLYNTAQTTITYSKIFGIYIFQDSRATISYSELWLIRVSANSLIGYSLNVLHCSTDSLSTSGW